MFKLVLENVKKYKALFIIEKTKNTQNKSVYAPVNNKGLSLCQPHQVRNVLIKWEPQILSS